MRFISLSYRILDLDFMSRLAWLKWKLKFVGGFIFTICSALASGGGPPVTMTSPWSPNLIDASEGKLEALLFFSPEKIVETHGEIDG